MGDIHLQLSANVGQSGTVLQNEDVIR